MWGRLRTRVVSPMAGDKIAGPTKNDSILPHLLY